MLPLNKWTFLNSVYLFFFSFRNQFISEVLRLNERVQKEEGKRASEEAKARNDARLEAFASMYHDIATPIDMLRSQIQAIDKTQLAARYKCVILSCATDCSKIVLISYCVIYRHNLTIASNCLEHLRNVADQLIELAKVSDDPAVCMYQRATSITLLR